MKTGQIICNQCKKPLVHPALLDVKMKCRANVGIAGDYEISQYPGITKGIMGCVEVDIEGDFCDIECLNKYAYKKAAEKDRSVEKVRQDIYFRDGPTIPGGQK